jgi:DNA-binding NtrC family response regulator
MHDAWSSRGAHARVGPSNARIVARGAIGAGLAGALAAREIRDWHGAGVIMMNHAVLVVDDEPRVLEALGDSLRIEGYDIATASSGEEALSRIEAREFDVIITDIVLPGMSGLDILEKARVFNPQAGVILISAYVTVEAAIEALQKGACDVLQKPFKLDELTACVTRVVEYRRTLNAKRLRQRAIHATRVGEGLVGESEAIHAVRRQISRCAPAPTNVLITGESGVGKELVARAIHAGSPRHDRRFVPVNCGAIPETLLESQLFGHVKGAFTSASYTNPGLFLVASGGTLFLDEIGEMPFPLQVKLLRVIEDRQVWPVGATKPVAVDVRLVASTNRDLIREIEAGHFREDLFYRLNVAHITLPPLRQRPEDIPLLVDHFIERLNLKLGTTFVGADRAALSVLSAQPWKGNVRELENTLERAMLLSEDDIIRPRHLAVEAAADGPRPTMLREAVRDFERRHVLEVLQQCDYDKRLAAGALGISLASLYRKLAIESEPAPIE